MKDLRMFFVHNFRSSFTPQKSSGRSPGVATCCASPTVGYGLGEEDMALATTRNDRPTVAAKVSAYIFAAGFESAQPLSFVKASDVVAAARAATGITDSCESFFNSALLRALQRATACKVVRLAPTLHTPSVGIGNVYWGVTCKSLPAAPLATSEWVECPLPDKKAARTAWRRARGLPPEADPQRRRIVGKRSTNHFTMYTNELLSLKCAPAPRMVEL